MSHPSGLHRAGVRGGGAARLGFHRGHIVRAVGSGGLGAALGHHPGAGPGRGVVRGPGRSAGGRRIMSAGRGWARPAADPLRDRRELGGRSSSCCSRSSRGCPAGGTAWRWRCCRSSGCSAGRSSACGWPPCWPPGVENPSTRIVVSIVVVVLLVALGETTGVFFGRRIRDRITGERTLQVDSTLGLGPAGHHGRHRGLAGGAAAGLGQLPRPRRRRARLRGAARRRLGDARRRQQLPDELRELLDNSGFPDVLSPFAETPITEVGAAEPALLNSPVVAEVAGSVLKIRGRAPSCSRPAGGHRLRRSGPSW